MQKLTAAEERIMKVLWKLEKGFPKEILAELKTDEPYNTILSTIRKLEKSGLIGYNKFGKSHQYYPILLKREYSKSIFKDLFKNYLDGSKKQLLSFFIEEETINKEELEELLNDLKDKK